MNHCRDRLPHLSIANLVSGATQRLFLQGPNPGDLGFLQAAKCSGAGPDPTKPEAGVTAGMSGIAGDASLVEAAAVHGSIQAMAVLSCSA